jgi:uncharacterized protein DUF262
LVGYINDSKINLIPSFQRGSVWTKKLRQKLLTNIVRGRPIPAIFIYKEESGSMYAYSILDGKQRLESLMLFIGNLRGDLRINNINEYFFARPLRKLRNFKIEIDDEEMGFKQLEESVVRDFREYAIPTIEISLEDSSMAEIVELFVDINSYGVKVSRFDVVKAMVKDPFLGTVLNLVAEKQPRGKAIHYKAKSSPINRVMNKLAVVARLESSNVRIDRIWERLAEIALFTRTGKHRRPIAVLKSFIKGGDVEQAALKQSEATRIRNVFKFLDSAYKASPILRQSKLATNEPQFYTLATSLLSSGNLIAQQGDTILTQKLERFAQIIDGQSRAPAGLESDFKEFTELTARATTDIGKRERRQELFLSVIAQL